MSAYDEDLVRLVQHLIRQNTAMTEGKGTVVTRDPGSNAATVVHDRATQPIPMKVSGNVYCRAGDRVLTQLQGTEWWVIGADTSLALGEANIQTAGSTQSTTSGSFVDVSGFPDMEFTKSRNSTYVRFGLSASFWASVSLPCAVRWGVRVTPLDPSPFAAADYAMGFVYAPVINQHAALYSFAWAINMPAGRYALTPRWRRHAGAGQANIDVGDWLHLEANEAVRWWG